MANLDFFAIRADHKSVIEFLFANTDCRIFESYSEFGRELREFRSFDDLASAYEVGEDKHGNGNAVLLQLWSPSVMPSLDIVRITLDPKNCNGNTFRFRINGGGLIQLYLGGVHDRVITASHYGHFSVKGAAKWEIAGGVEWEALQKLSNKIQYHIKKRLAVARVPGMPVLPGAFELFQTGFVLKRYAMASWQYDALTGKEQSCSAPASGSAGSPGS